MDDWGGRHGRLAQVGKSDHRGIPIQEAGADRVSLPLSPQRVPLMVIRYPNLRSCSTLLRCIGLYVKGCQPLAVAINLYRTALHLVSISVALTIEGIVRLRCHIG